MNTRGVGNKRNRIQCALCEDIIESRHQYDYVTCSCGEVFVDGGKDSFRRGAHNLDNIIDLATSDEMKVDNG